MTYSGTERKSITYLTKFRLASVSFCKKCPHVQLTMPMFQYDRHAVHCVLGSVSSNSHNSMLPTSWIIFFDSGLNWLYAWFCRRSCWRACRSGWFSIFWINSRTLVLCACFTTECGNPGIRKSMFTSFSVVSSTRIVMVNNGSHRSFTKCFLSNVECFAFMTRTCLRTIWHIFCVCFNNGSTRSFRRNSFVVKHLDIPAVLPAGTEHGGWWANKVWRRRPEPVVRKHRRQWRRTTRKMWDGDVVSRVVVETNSAAPRAGPAWEVDKCFRAVNCISTEETASRCQSKRKPLGSWIPQVPVEVVGIPARSPMTPAAAPRQFVCGCLSNWFTSWTATSECLRQVVAQTPFCKLAQVCCTWQIQASQHQKRRPVDSGFTAVDVEMWRNSHKHRYKPLVQTKVRSHELRVANKSPAGVITSYQLEGVLPLAPRHRTHNWFHPSGDPHASHFSARDYKASRSARCADDCDPFGWICLGVVHVGESSNWTWAACIAKCCPTKKNRNIYASLACPSYTLHDGVDNSHGILPQDRWWVPCVIRAHDRAAHPPSIRRSPWSMAPREIKSNVAVVLTSVSPCNERAALAASSHRQSVLKQNHRVGKLLDQRASHQSPHDVSSHTASHASTWAKLSAVTGRMAWTTLRVTCALERRCATWKKSGTSLGTSDDGCTWPTVIHRWTSCCVPLCWTVVRAQPSLFPKKWRPKHVVQNLLCDCLPCFRWSLGAICHALQRFSTATSPPPSATLADDWSRMDRHFSPAASVLQTVASSALTTTCHSFLDVAHSQQSARATLTGQIQCVSKE